MAGFQVDRNLLDMRSAEAVLAVRDAFQKVVTVSEFLATQPKTDTTDTLTSVDGVFKYTEDEAYLLRMLFDQLRALNVDPILETGRKLTGLA